MQQTQKYWNKISLAASCILILILITGIIIAFSPKVKNLKKYRNIHTANTKKIDHLKNQEIQTKENINRIINDPAFIERVAREKGYVREDETIFYLSDEIEDNE